MQLEGHVRKLPNYLPFFFPIALLSPKVSGSCCD